MFHDLLATIELPGAPGRTMYAWRRPLSVAVAGGRLVHSWYVNGREGPLVNPDSEAESAFEAFLALSAGTEEKVRRWVARYGTLALRPSGVPESESEMRQVEEEPIALYITYSKMLTLGLKARDAANGTGALDWSDVQALDILFATYGAKFVKRTTVNSFRIAVHFAQGYRAQAPQNAGAHEARARQLAPVAVASWWMAAGDVRLQPASFGARTELVWTGGLWAHLGLHYMEALLAPARRAQWMCNHCGLSMPGRKRAPKKGQRNYCRRARCTAERHALLVRRNRTKTKGTA